MKKQTWIYVSTFMAFLFFSTADLSAQRHNSNYDYNDDIVIVTNYGDGYYNGDRRRNKRSRKQIQHERRWKASILDRAYAIALADGRIGRRERRELNKLERELGITKRNKKRRY